MSFKFSSKTIPSTIAWARGLAIIQGVLILYSALYSLALGLLFGNSGSLVYGALTLSGTGLIVASLVQAALGACFILLIVQLGRLSPASRIGIVIAEVVYAGLTLASGSILNEAITGLMAIAIVGLIFVPQSQIAFAPTPASSVATDLTGSDVPIAENSDPT